MTVPLRRSGAPLSLRLAASLSALVFAAPGAYLIWRNITSDADPLGQLSNRSTLEPLWRTIQLAVLVSLAAAVLGTGLAWLTTRTDVPFRRAFRVLLPMPLVYPSFVGAAAFVRTLNPGGLVATLLERIGLDSTPQLSGLFGAWFVLTVFTYPYVYLPVAARLAQLPGSIEQSAALLGNPPLDVFRRIVLPQIAPSITAGSLLVFLYAISDFGAVAILRYDTLTRAMETTYLAKPDVALALSLLLLALAGLVVYAERRAQRNRGPVGPVRTLASAPVALGRWRPVAFTAATVVVVMSLLAPLASLVDWAIRGLLRTRDGGRLTVDGEEVLSLTVDTFLLGAAAATVTVIAVLPIAFLVARHRSSIGTIAHNITISTFALPGLLIALAAVFWTLQWDWAFETFNKSMVLLVAAYVIRFAALAMGTALVAVQAVPEAARDAAHTLGADRRRRLLTVDLPMMIPGLLAALGLVLLSVMKELPISLLLRPFDFDTLTTRMFNAFSESFIAETGLLALALVFLSFIATRVLVLRDT